MVAVLALGAAGASATITVNTTKDETISGDGSCSLREAIETASGNPSADCAGASPSGQTTIEVPAGDYRLSLGSELAADSQIAIVGGGADASQTVIDAALHSRVLLTGGTVTLSRLTITGGRAGAGAAGQPGQGGGGILNTGLLTLTNVALSGNAAGAGGGGEDGTPGTECTSGAVGGDGGNGGGIDNEGILSMTRVTVSGNQAGDGGAGGSGGERTSGPRPGCSGGDGGSGGAGAGIYSDQSLTLASSTISADAAGNGGHGGDGGSGASTGDGGSGGRGGDGGGIAIAGPGSMTASTSTIASDMAGNGGFGGSGGAGGAGGRGGGLSAGGDPGSSTSLQNSTIAQDAAGDGGYGGGSAGGPGTGATGGAGGGVFAGGGSLQLSSDTISSDAAGGGGGPIAGTPGQGGAIAVDSASIGEQQTLVAAGSPQNCAGPVTDGGDDLSFPDTTCPHEVTGDPLLGPLQDYGGPTETVGLRAGSAAIDQVPSGSGCPSTDQRGVVRPQPAGGSCDIGAYEYALPVCRALADATAMGQPLRIALACGDPSALAVQYALVHRTAHGSLTALDPAAGKVTYTPRVGFAGHDSFTYLASDANGSSVARTVSLTVVPVPPAITKAKLAPRSFTVEVGAQLRFTLSAASELDVTIDGRRGRRLGVLRFAHQPAGADRLAFDGIIGARKLVAGAYTASLVATNAGGRSAAVKLSFVILG